MEFKFGHENIHQYIELHSYRNKGINAYLSPTDERGKGIMAKNRYGSPKKGDEVNSYKGKHYIAQIRISDLPDGRYIYKEAGGSAYTKVKYGWIVLKDGEIVDEG